MKLFLIILSFLFFNICKGQNLVINPSFEDTIRCPNSIYHNDLCVNWYTYRFSSDYFNICNKTSGGVPKNQFGIQNAATGNAYCGIITLSPSTGDYSEILGGQLKEQLIIGKKYFISFKVNLANISSFGCNKLGALFLTQPSTDPGTFALTNRASVYSSSIITDYKDWTIIAGSFIADSGYRYIALGNLFKESLTDKKMSDSPDAGESFAYYYIDDVCVSSDSTCYSKVSVTALSKERVIIVCPNPFEDVLTFRSDEYSTKEVVIFDPVSKEIDRQIFSDSVSFNFGHLNAGVYYYQITNQFGLIERGKLVKN